MRLDVADTMLDLPRLPDLSALHLAYEQRTPPMLQRVGCNHTPLFPSQSRPCACRCSRPFPTIWSTRGLDQVGETPETMKIVHMRQHQLVLGLSVADGATPVYRHFIRVPNLTIRVTLWGCVIYRLNSLTLPNPCSRLASPL